ncbi:MAG: diaminopimelate epimerase [Bacteroidetes bacterium]|nr:diaminopimelate epimerase [Bacteroidota bacterium]
MRINFYKYHGTGNDFIMIDDRENLLRLSEEQVRLICDRHFGIGGDGLIRILKSKEADFEMVYYNSDGKLGSMCGNGGRCTVAFAHFLGMIKTTTRFKAFDGLHDADIISSSPYIVKLKMSDVAKIRIHSGFTLLDTGSPHYVRFDENVKKLDVYSFGKEIRYSNSYREKGVNVNFVEVEENGLFVRTYERGVEDETLSCGTGVTASVIAAVELEKWTDGSPCAVITPGGKLRVYFTEFNDTYTDVWLEGPAEAVFSGQIALD